MTSWLDEPGAGRSRATSSNGCRTRCAARASMLRAHARRRNAARGDRADRACCAPRRVARRIGPAVRPPARRARAVRHRAQRFEGGHDVERRHNQPPEPSSEAVRLEGRLDFDDLIYGIHAVDEALARRRSACASIHVAANRKKDARCARCSRKRKSETFRCASSSARSSSAFRSRRIKASSRSRRPFPYVSLPRAAGGPRGRATSTLVVLDHLTDPHNVGAIIRTAEAAGADGLVLPERRSAGINATVRKAAAGAAAHLPIARVANIADAIRVLKKAGIWVAGADASPGARRAGTGRPQPRPGAGHRRRRGAVSRSWSGGSATTWSGSRCEASVASLNASVAAAILLYEAVRQRDCSLRP